MEQEAEVTKQKIDDNEANSLRAYLNHERDLSQKAQVAQYAKQCYLSNLIQKYGLPQDKELQLTDNNELEIVES